MDSKDWYEVIHYNSYIIVIREKLSEIDPRFLTTYTNLFLILGINKSLLVDTGCGLFPLRPIIEELIEGRELLVINTHSHFDHIGSNSEFEEVYIHENEINKITNPIDISFLKNSTKEVVSQFKDTNFVIKPAKNIKILRNGDKFDLGEIQIEIIHCPGHSKGSISLCSNRGELFTGDNAHYGTIFLPSEKLLLTFTKMVKNLIKLCERKKIKLLYPSHENYVVNKNLLTELIDSLTLIKTLWNFKKHDEFNNAWRIDFEKFKFMINIS